MTRWMAPVFHVALAVFCAVVAFLPSQPTWLAIANGCCALFNVAMACFHWPASANTAKAWAWFKARVITLDMALVVVFVFVLDTAGVKLNNWQWWALVLTVTARVTIAEKAR